MVQINLHHCEAASHNLLTTLRRLEVDIALIQEPCTLRDRILGLSDPDYRLLASRTSEKVRTRILARGKMDLLITPFFCTNDVSTVAFRDDLGIDLMLSSVYMPYEVASPPDELIRLLVEHAKRKRCRLVLGCHANAHHTQWGNADINTTGKSILNFIILNRLNICNVGNTPTFRNRVREAVINITLSNMDRSMIRGRRISDECFL